MFGRKPANPSKDRLDSAPAPNPAAHASAPATSPIDSGEPADAQRAAPGLLRPTFQARPVGDGPAAARLAMPKSEVSRSEAPRAEPPAKPFAVEGKELIVGRDICLSGEITDCDLLIIEGRIEATLKNSNAVEILEHGTFKGTAEIAKADVSGVFEGDLTVRERLVVRRSGRVKGKLRYGSIQIEPGGEISGAVELLPKSDSLTKVQAATGD